MKPKKPKSAAALAVLAGLFLFVGRAHAEAVNVSSSSVTTIAQGGSFNGLVFENNGGQTVYISSTRANTTVAAGLPISSGSIVNIDQYQSPLYGIAAAGSSGVDVRYLKRTR